ncbi:MAG: hypothetical protein ACJAYU_000527 [Bradymonadia bacterium]|jgi:hypothetical protein
MRTEGEASGGLLAAFFRFGIEAAAEVVNAGRSPIGVSTLIEGLQAQVTGQRVAATRVEAGSVVSTLCLTLDTVRDVSAARSRWETRAELRLAATID